MSGREHMCPTPAEVDRAERITAETGVLVLFTSGLPKGALGINKTCLSFVNVGYENWEWVEDYARKIAAERDKAEASRRALEAREDAAALARVRERGLIA